jgi:hypothetical protein
MATMTHDKAKCAHTSCTCPPQQGSKYCSNYCHDARGTIELACNCGHPDCGAETVTAEERDLLPESA